MLRAMIPWLILAVVAVPLVVLAFASVRRRSSESVADLDPDETEAEFAAAEAYEAEWHKADEERFHQERLP